MSYDFKIGTRYEFTLNWGTKKVVGEVFSEKDYKFYFQGFNISKFPNSWVKAASEVNTKYNYIIWPVSKNNNWDKDRVKPIGYINKNYKLLYGDIDGKALSSK